MGPRYLVNVATLVLDTAKCTGCGMCLAVCPREVFAWAGPRVIIADLDACLECGACALNCSFGALQVQAGVGCAAALLQSARDGQEPSCGCAAGKKSSCC